MLSVGLETHHENLAGVLIHRLNPWSRVQLWTPISDLGGQAIHRVHDSTYENGRHATPCQLGAETQMMFPF
jgi:hypothetical protein